MLAKHRVLTIGMTGLAALCDENGRCEELSETPQAASEQRAGQLGLNLFGLSLHTDRSAGNNEVNPGIGLRYTFWEPAPRWTLFADTSVYYDSGRNWAKYIALGTSYRFAESWYAGVGVGYAQSQSYNHGKPFFAPIAGIGFEHRRVTYNAVLLPSEDASSKIAGIGFFVTVPLGKYP